MKNRYTIWRCLTALMLVMVGVCACTDELDGLGVDSTRPSDVICFTASLSDNRTGSQTRSASGHLEIEQEEWLVGTEQSITRGTPVTLLEGSAGVIGYVYETWQENAPAVDETPAIKGTLPWETLYNKEFKFDGDELTAASGNVRWNTLDQPNVRFYAYAPYDQTGETLSSKEQGGSPQLKYTVNETPKNQNDLIVASWEGQSDYKQSIPLVFNHALTAVRFKIGFDCTVTKLEVKGIYNSGTYTFGKEWEVNTISSDANAQLTSNYTFTFGENGSGQPFSANAFLTDGDNTLMMIPQTLSAEAKVVLTYIEGEKTKTITSTLKDKVWQEGKMITYTIHKTSAPTTIYFDLAAGNVLIGINVNQFDNKGTYANGTEYRGYVFVNGEVKPVQGTHNNDNVYHVYQSSTSSDYSQYNAVNTGYANETDFNNKQGCRIPQYASVKHGNISWRDYITNNTSVDDVIEMWDDGQYVRDDQESASKEQNIGTARVREVGRTHTKNHILVKGAGNSESSIQYKLTVDDIYSTWQYHDPDDFRGRSYGGITYYPNGNTNLTINLLGDNRVGYVHINNQRTDYITFEGTGTLTAANADFITPDDFTDKRKWDNSYYGISETSDERRYISNHRKSAIGNDTQSSGQVYNLTFNSGTIFAGTTKIENCSAIGGGGNGYGQVFINGGTVTAVATTTGAAIGGGIGFSDVGGEGHVTIAGGNVYAYNFANRWDVPSSSIGGGGSKNSVGKLGNINITGGYVYAYSALGTAIGGGSSQAQGGGNAEITITGGQIIAKSGTGAGIGGGSSRTIGTGSTTVYNGGSATVKILGNPIIRTGSIGGGTTGHPKGKLGSANISIEGGDIQAQFVMEAGSTVTPTFEMSGGTIRNSYVNDNEYIHTKKFGGAVYLEDGIFTMSGGTIKNCSAEQGGAVYVNSQSGNSTFTMTGGEIHSCFATGTYNNVDSLINPGHGGAVCLMGGQVNMSGGKIRNNYSENGDGGAVYISNGNFAMKNGSPEITANAAHKGNGGGVFVTSQGSGVEVDLLQGIITNNTANNYGGGICVDMGNTENTANVTVGANGQGVTESDANPKISGNMAMMSGGGLYVRGTSANVTINSGMIAQNRVSAYVKNEDVANEMGGVTLNAGLVTHVVVTFDGNGGKVDGTDTYTQNIVTNTNSKLAPNRFERDGYDFAGWNTRADGLGESYSDEEAEPLSGHITLYAQWKAQ